MEPSFSLVSQKFIVINTHTHSILLPPQVFFKQSFNIGKISSTNTNGVAKPGTVEVQCIPVYSLMLALNVTTVDYFSLDVEGVELDVLRTIPWDKVQINVSVGSDL